MTFLDKKEAGTLAQSSFWLDFCRAKHSIESHKMFRMNTLLFCKLHNLLVSIYGMERKVHMNSMESLDILLLVCGHSMSISSLHCIFKYSIKTIS